MHSNWVSSDLKSRFHLLSKNFENQKHEEEKLRRNQSSEASHRRMKRHGLSSPRNLLSSVSQSLTYCNILFRNHEIRNHM